MSIKFNYQGSLPTDMLSFILVMIGFLFATTVFAQRVKIVDEIGTKDITGNVVTRGSTAPATAGPQPPIQGDVWLDTTDPTNTTPKVWDGSTWEAIDATEAGVWEYTGTNAKLKTLSDGTARTDDKNVFVSDIGNLGVGTASPNSDADLDLGSNDKGFLANRVALSATNAPSPLSAHIAGMFVFNTATAGTAPNNVVPGMYFNTGTEWVMFLTPNSEGSVSPPGVVEAFAGNNIPVGWLLCDGSAVSRLTYAKLFAEIGTTYGAGDGSTTFNVPDLRGEFIRGVDAGRGIDSDRVLGSAQTDEFQAHWHHSNLVGNTVGNTTTTLDHAFGLGSITASTSGQRVETFINDPQSTAEGNETHFRTDNSPTSSTENRPRNIAMNYIIKF